MINNYNILFLKETYLLIYYKQSYQNFLYDLTKNILYNNNEFISITINNNELSLIIEDKYEKNFKDIDDNRYMILQFFENTHSINHVGIVNEISELFKQNDIPILYINSYNNNYILFNKNDYDKVVSLIN